MINLRAFGASGVIGDTSSAMAAWQAASDYFAARGGGTLMIPNNTVTRAGASAWCVDWKADRVRFEFEPGARMQLAAGQPAVQLSMFHANNRRELRFVGGIFDGNWGARVGITNRTPHPSGTGNQLLGINHATRTDPGLRCTSVRGCRGVSFHGTEFLDTYGDWAWVGHEVADNDPTTPEDPSVDILFDNCVGDRAGRNGISLAGAVLGVRVIGGVYTNTMAGCIDLEHAGAQDVEIVGVRSKLWWDAGNPIYDHAKIGLTLDGSGVDSQRIVVDRCTMEGSLLIQRVVGARVSRSTFTIPWVCQAQAPLQVRFDADDVVLDDVELRTAAYWVTNPDLQDTKNLGRACAVIQYYAATNPATGVTAYSKPRNVTLQNVRTRATGIKVHGVSVIGTDGALGVVRLLDCDHDGTREDGTSNGGRGVDVFSEKPGMNVEVVGQRTRNATGPSVQLRFTGNPVNAMARFKTDELRATDDQDVATCSAVLDVGPQRHAAQITVGSATKSASVPAMFTGWP